MMGNHAKRFLPIIMFDGGMSASDDSQIDYEYTTQRGWSSDSREPRIGSTYSVSGNNITAGTMGGLTKASGDNAATAAATQTQGAYSVTTAGSAFSLTESFTMGDAVGNRNWC